MAQDAPATKQPNNLRVLTTPTNSTTPSVDPYWFINVLRAKDATTGNHCVRVFDIADEWLADREKRSVTKSDERVSWSLAALLHDVGKLGVSDAILSKGEALSETERTEIERHSDLGYELVRDLPNLSGIADLIRAHHERWDGAGYPFRMAANAIPEGSRVIAIVDAFDAMTGNRPYRNPFTEEQALAEIERCAGSQFCPTLAIDFVRFRRARRQ